MFKNGEYSSIKTDAAWYQEACKVASGIGGILILYPFYGDALAGSRIFKVSRWMRGKRGTVIIKSDGTLMQNIKGSENLPLKIRLFFKYFFIDKVICENENDFNQFKRSHPFFSRKLFLLPNSPLELYSNQEVIPISQRENCFLFVGRVSDEEKGADILLDTWINFQRDIPGWTLLLAGPCSEYFKTKWSRKLANLGLANVYWLGSQQPESLLKLYQTSKIVICTSRKESGPIVLAEAALSGCAFISSAVGEVPLILRGLRGLVFDMNFLGNEMVLFANNPDLIYEQAAVLHERMAGRSWTQQVKKIFN